MSTPTTGGAGVSVGITRENCNPRQQRICAIGEFQPFRHKRENLYADRHTNHHRLSMVPTTLKHGEIRGEGAAVALQGRVSSPGH